MVDRNALKGDSPEIWTKESLRIVQITALEDKINLYKEAGQWGLVLNSMEDYLRFQMEAMEEKLKENNADGTPTKRTVIGMATPTWNEMSTELRELVDNWELLSINKIDPATRMNDQEERRELIRRIKDLLNRIYNNNVKFALTYKRKDDPMKAAYQ